MRDQRARTHRRGRRAVAWSSVTALAAGTMLLAGSAGAVPPSSTPSWARQFGTSGGDHAVDVAVSSTGVVYSVGYTSGNLAGTNKGSADIWVARHNPSGTRRWTKQFGTDAIDYAQGIAVSPLGEVFVVGASEGSLAGTNIQPGYNDGFIAKYDQYGRRRWIRQVASPTGADDDIRAVAVSSSGEIFVAGTTTGEVAGAGSSVGDTDIWVARYDRNGNRAWIQQYGTTAVDLVNGLAVAPGGRVFVIGETEGSFPDTTANAGDRDFFMIGYDRTGTRQGNMQWGTSEYDTARGIAAGSFGEVYVAGTTNGRLTDEPSAGGSDAVLFRIDFDISGGPGITWTRQLGSDLSDEWRDVVVRGSNIYTVGHTVRSIAQPTAGGYDFLAARYSVGGERRWIDQFGTGGTDITEAAAVSRSGDLYLVGGTDGTLGAASAGGDDAAIVRYSATRNNSWVDQIGSAENDYFYAVAAASDGSVWSAGTSTGTVWGAHSGGLDVLLTKHDSSGNEISTVTFGTIATDFALGAAPGPSGSVVVVGATGGDFAAFGSNAGDYDGFVAMLDSNGSVLWKRQLGSIYYDSLAAVAVTPAGDIYVTGTAGGPVEGQTWSGATDVMIAKYDRFGTRKWLRQTGTEGDDYARGIGISNTGALYVVGENDYSFTTGLETPALPFVMRYTTGGTRRWARQYDVTGGSGSFVAVAVTPGGEVYAAGLASGSMQSGVTFQGVRDLVVARINTTGSLRWTRQYGTAASDRAYGIAVTPGGTVTVVGTTRGSMGVNEGTPWATPAAGDEDIVVMKFNRNGTRTSVRQWGTVDYDEANAVAVTSRGTVYIAGSTVGTLGSSSAGDMDAVTIRLNT